MMATPPSRKDLLAEVEALRQERDALLVDVETLRQEVVSLQQERNDLEIMLETTTDHFDHLAEALRQERDDLKNMLEVTTAHFDRLAEVLRQERDDLETVLEMTTDHSDMIEAELHSKTEELEKWNQFIRDTFGRYVSDDVVNSLLDSPAGLRLGGEKRQVTILMSDVRGFTALAERLDPQEVLTFLNRYLEAMVTVILSYQGTIIEILGDGLLVIFGAPIQRQDDAQHAVACAVAMQLQMQAINAANRPEGLPDVGMGIGIHTGDVIVGNIGSQQRAKYGAVGSAVNLAGRIESYTTGDQILISNATFNETAALLKITQQMTVEPKGVSEPLTIYEVGGIGGAYQLFLPDYTEALVSLDEAISVRYTVLEEKFAGRTVFAGRLVSLSTKAAVLQTDHAVAALSNLKLQLLTHSGEAIPGELFAKVVETPTEPAPRVVIRFTSVPEGVKAFLAQRQRAS
jgi:adenylate cyclase